MTWKPAVTCASVQARTCCCDRVGVDVTGAGAFRRVGIRLVQPGGVGSERAVHKQVTGQPAGPGLVYQRAGVSGRADGFTPVAGYLDPVFEGRAARSQSSRPPIWGPAHSCTATIPAAASGVQCRHPGFGQLLAGQQAAGGGPDQVVSVAGQRQLIDETRRRR